MLACCSATTYETTVLSLAFDDSDGVARTAAQPEPMKPAARVLVFYPGNFMAKANGSQARVASLVQHLVASGAQVSVYTYGNLGQGWTSSETEAFHRCYPGARLLLDDEGWGLKLARLIKKSAIQLLPGSSGTILSWEVPGCAPKLHAWKRENPGGVFLVNYVDNVSRLNGVAPSHTVVETHDFQYFRRSKGAAKSLWSLPGLLRLRHEVATLSAVGGIVAISRTEEYAYRNLAPRSQVFFVPLYDSIRAFAQRLAGNEYEYDLLFVGSSNRVNELGLLEFIRSCPWSRQYRVAVCGKICELESIRSLASNEKNLKLLGFQEELGSVYQSAMACICPTNGTGLNIKILEALSYGKPVFASRDAMDALPSGFDGCVFPLSAARVSQILAAPAALDAAGTAAMEYYRRLPEAGDVQTLDAHLAEVSARRFVESNPGR